MTTELAVPEKELRESGQALIRDADAIQITNHATFEVAGRFLVNVAALKKSIEAALNPVVDAAHKTHKAATTLRADLLAGPAKADTIVRARMLDYQRKEAAERQRVEHELQEAERKRLEDERLRQAQMVADAGHQEVAEALLDAPIVVAPVELPKPKAEGVSTRKVVTFRIIDASKINRPYLVPDETKIRNQVKATGKDAEKLVGGIEVYEEEGLAVRAGR